VHQLRYVFAYGADAGRELAEQGDEYVHSLVPWLVLGAVAAIGLWIAAATGRPRAEAPRPPLRRLWASASAALIGAYFAQEALEVLTGSAHATLPAQALGNGGWWAIPASLALGLAWALVARGAAVVIARIADARDVRRAARRKATADPGHRPVIATRRRCVLARRLAGRAPPGVPVHSMS